MHKFVQNGVNNDFLTYVKILLQVLFALVNLEVPDALVSAKPAGLTASQISIICKCKRKDWVNRLLKAAAALGLISKRKCHVDVSFDSTCSAFVNVDDYEFFR
jgi:hypothetical protein